MRIARNDAEFRTVTKKLRKESDLAVQAAAYVHNKGLLLKALDPTRGKENDKFFSAVERIFARVAKIAGRNAASKALLAE